MIRTCTSYNYAITIKEGTDDLKLKEILYLVLSCGSLSAKYTSFEYILSSAKLDVLGI